MRPRGLGHAVEEGIALGLSATTQKVFTAIEPIRSSRPFESCSRMYVAPMMVWLTLGVVVSAMLVSAQTTNGAGGPSAAADTSILVAPSPGVPVSLEQIEEDSGKSDGGASTANVKESRVHRDSSGRTRTESDSSAYTVLIDPVAGSTVVLLRSGEIAYRMPGPRGASFRLARTIAAGYSIHNWSQRTETIGKLTIEGLVFHGTRIIQTADDDPGLIYTVEQWYSDELKLTGLEVVSGPHGTHTARVRNLHWEEPDPALFTIPSGYKVIDAKLSDQP